VVDEAIGDGAMAHEESEEIVPNFRCGQDVQYGVGEPLTRISDSLKKKEEMKDPCWSNRVKPKIPSQNNALTGGNKP